MSEHSYVVGIDPGLYGGIAFIDTIQLTLEVFDPPLIEIAKKKSRKVTDKVTGLTSKQSYQGVKTDYNDLELAKIFQNRNLFQEIKSLYLERSIAMPGQSAVSTAAIWEGQGIYRGIIGALQLPRTRVTPAEWKRDMRTNADKEGASLRAMELMPRCAELFCRPSSRAKNGMVYFDGRAESALIALWGVGDHRLSIGAKLTPISRELKAVA
jgi:hypothetical protein